VFKLSSRNNGGEVSIVEHPFAVGLLTAAHRHTREDEHSIVLAGEIGFRSDDSEVVLGPGGYITKPRGQMHAMWNAGSVPGRIVDVITPGGFENYFRELGETAPRARRRPGREGAARAARIRRARGQIRADVREPGLDGRHQAALRAEPAVALNPTVHHWPQVNARFGRCDARSVTCHLPTRGGAAR
jgi:quercetin dioxygenase-like cupin family protein